ncbi:MAG: hypothetical protein WCG96_06120 [Actinomycetes bacterium]
MTQHTIDHCGVMRDHNELRGAVKHVNRCGADQVAAERRYLSEQSMAQMASTTVELNPEAGPASLMA